MDCTSSQPCLDNPSFLISDILSSLPGVSNSLCDRCDPMGYPQGVRAIALAYEVHALSRSMSSLPPVNFQSSEYDSKVGVIMVVSMLVQILAFFPHEDLKSNIKKGTLR